LRPSRGGHDSLLSAKRYRFLTKAQLADEPAPSGAASSGDGFEALGEALEGSDCLGGLGAFLAGSRFGGSQGGFEGVHVPGEGPPRVL